MNKSIVHLHHQVYHPRQTCINLRPFSDLFW
uniref:Uncharacterized protein n=1 Tax=Tetranychus urticae TaxID=32264 RepID=T1KAP3_TETUR